MVCPQLATRSLCASAVLVLACAATPTAALDIHRFGGSGDSTSAGPGVRLVRHGWNHEATGAAFELDISDERIAALRRDPTVNVAPSVGDAGGIYWHGSKNGAVWDGDTSTVWTNDPYLCAKTFSLHLVCVDDFGSLGTISVILGSLFQVERIRIKSGLRDRSRVVQGVRVFTSVDPPGYPWSAANPVPPQHRWEAEVRDNRAQILDIELPDVREAGFVQVALQEHTDPWDVHEVEIYARGFVRRSTWTSDALDLGQPMAFGALRWSGSKGDRAVVQVQTRSGVDADPIRHWRYTGRGAERSEVDRAEYDELRPGERAGTSDDLRHWSPWSTYAFGDSLTAHVTSPGPRRYLQVRVDFLPEGDDGGQVSQLELHVSTPVARAVVGEVWPVEAPVGLSQPFSYVLRPTIDASNSGFDRLELRSGALLGDVHTVTIADEVVPVHVELSTAHRVVLALPRVAAAQSGATVQVDFDASLLRYGDRFDAFVWDSQRPLEVHQSVVAGDATPASEWDRTAVATIPGPRLAVRFDRVLSPNGDGVNDSAVLEFDVLEISGTAGVHLTIRDLSGRRVRSLPTERLGVGRYRRAWDGRDDAGRLVPPGAYSVRVTAQTDAGDLTRTRILHVVY